jgi:thiamine-monophosphate kinase
MLIKDLGEIRLINRIQRIIKNRDKYNHILSDNLLVGIGDYAAVWKASKCIQVATTDTMVEGIHFNKGTIPFRDVGWKAISSNLSDVAAMGATPLYALINLGLRPETPVNDIDELYAGFLDACIEYNLQIIGGNLVSSPTTFIAIQITGESTHAPMLRSNAKPLDQIGIIGWIGSSKGGFELISHPRVITSTKAKQQLLNAHLHPIPRLKEGNILIGNGVSAAMDISDGLLTDLHKFCKASRVSAKIDGCKLPIEKALINVFPDNYMDYALNGGEDYALMFSTSPKIMKHLKRIVPAPISIIGNVEDGPIGEVIIIDKLRNHILTASSGWDHYK